MFPHRAVPVLLTLALLALSPATHAGEADATADSRKMEAMLAQSMLAVTNNRPDLALNEVDSLLKINPNFKLAQLVKGDLLLARSKPLNSFGDVPNAPRGSVEDFRDEARMRLHRYQEHPPSTLLPKYLWKLDDDQRYAIVVDISRATLYLYENVNGEPHYVADYYITSGKKGADKVSEGDQKTPLGVYFAQDGLSKNQLTDFYGSGAYPLNYPNEWDRKQGHDGHGIWLHGTPSDTYSRPPRASNGCVVLSNDDLKSVGKVLQAGVTPIIIASQIDWSGAQDQAERSALMDEIEQWRTDWASLNTETYLAHYAADFNSGGTDLAGWAQQKRLVNSGKTWIKVKVSHVSVFSYPDQPNLAVVNFRQDYSSNNLSNSMKKRQYWIKQDNRWKIIYEGAA